MADLSQPLLQPLGRSLALDHGDLVVIRSAGRPATTTFAMIAGPAALAQALAITLETQLGSDPLSATHGFDQLAVGENPYGVRTRKEYIKLHLVRAVGADRRVKDIKELFFDDDPRFLDFHPELGADEQRRRVRASRRFTATLLLETHDGDTVTVRVGDLGG